jgi:hypothetical protein
MKKLILLCIVLTLLVCCCGRIDNEELAKYWWKHGSGHHFTDVLIFSTEKVPCTNKKWVAGDTLYSGDIPFALITEAEMKLDGTLKLYLRDFSTGEEGVYHEKGKKTHFE